MSRVFFNCYWNIVDLQGCVSFRCTAIRWVSDVFDTLQKRGQMDGPAQNLTKVIERTKSIGGKKLWNQEPNIFVTRKELSHPEYTSGGHSVCAQGRLTSSKVDLLRDDSPSIPIRKQSNKNAFHFIFTKWTEVCVRWVAVRFFSPSGSIPL